MKALFFILFTLGFCLLAAAQVPTTFSYQAVARNAEGDCLQNQTISLQISIVKDSPNGSILYQERFEGSVHTNEVGHFQIEIGSGFAQTSGLYDDFAKIPWNNQDLYLKVEYAPGASTSFVLVGTTQLLTVPFAKVAQNGKLYSSTNKDEYTNFTGTNGNANVTIGGIGTGTNRNHGYIGLKNETGSVRSEMYASHSTGAGWLELKGANGENNVVLGSMSANANRGYVAVRDENNTTQASLTIDASGKGVVAADIKNFVMPHPNKPDKEIVYACIEGPEAGAYERGTAQLVDGEAEVFFSETFEIVANPAQLELQVTTRGDNAVGVDEVADRIKVKLTDREGGRLEGLTVDGAQEAASSIINYRHRVLVRRRAKA